MVLKDGLRRYSIYEGIYGNFEKRANNIEIKKKVYDKRDTR